MQVVVTPYGWYPDDINKKLCFEDYSTMSPTEALFVGIGCTELEQVISYMQPFGRRIYVNLEHPCTLYGGPNALGLGPVEQQRLFHEVYTICPYTAEWLNALDVGTIFRAMPYPHHLRHDVYEGVEKDYDVAYCGLVHSEEIASYIRTMSKFKYYFSSITRHNRVSSVNELVTHQNVPINEKWDHLARSKIAIIQNNLYLNRDQIENIKKLPRWEENRAFSEIESGLLPQLKSRTVESAFCRALMLVKRDPWNVIEEWFVEGEDFVYFDNTEDLEGKIHTILDEWEEYEDLVASAHHKVKTKYNTQHIFNCITEGKEID